MMRIRFMFILCLAVATIDVKAQINHSSSSNLTLNEFFAGVTDAENASYAIKSAYLRNLRDALDVEIRFPQSQTLVGKKLSSQLSSVRDFVYIIECH